MDQANFFPWDEIPDSNVLPTGIYMLEVIEFVDGYASTGKRMPKAQFKVLEPVDFAGMPYFENYVVGTDENVTEFVKGSMGSRSMKQMLNAAQVPPSNDPAQLMLSAKSTRLLMHVSYYEEQAGEYKGTPKNRTIKCYKIGERDIGLIAEPGGGRGSVAAPTAAPPGAINTVVGKLPLEPAVPTAPPVAAPATVTEAPPPAEQPLAPPVTAAPAPAPTPQVVTPAPGGAPVVAPPAAPTPPVTPPAAPAPAGSLRCMVCNADVPAAEFGAHVTAHTQQPTATG